jgi:REP element-mobilizing transposase RayT
MHYFAMVWLITISCYGSHLPGDDRGSYDHRRCGEKRWIAPSPALEAHRRKFMRSDPFLLDNAQYRRAVLEAIIKVCQYRNWPLLALHIRTSHLHGVVESPNASYVLRDWKSYSTRSIRRLPAEPPGRDYWTRGGSANVLRSAEAVRAAVNYVLEKQGQAMSAYNGDSR